MEQHTCIVRLLGGLGNQLFQYAAGLNAVSGSIENLFVDTTYYLYVRNRRYILEDLSLEAKVIQPWSHPLEYPLRLPIIGASWSKFYSDIFANRYQIYTEKELSVFDSGLQEIDSNVYLDGFWQHHKYVDMQEKNLRKLLKFPQELTVNAATTDIHTKKETVSIHVRRGDYLKSTNFAVCDLEYYKNAINYFRKKLKNPYFFIFSDDLDWCKQQFTQSDIQFVQGVNEVEDLSLMSACRHHIIANSTFSWWGAWLGNGGGTIAPKKWSNDPQAAQALLYKDWIKL